MENPHAQASIHVLTELAAIRQSLLHIQEGLAKLDGHLEGLENRLRAVEISNAQLKVQVGLWGGCAGIASLVWQLVRVLG